MSYHLFGEKSNLIIQEIWFCKTNPDMLLSEEQNINLTPPKKKLKISIQMLCKFKSGGI